MPKSQGAIRNASWSARSLRALIAAFAAMAMLLAVASSASALSLGLQWTGGYDQTPNEMDVVGKSGASFFRMAVQPGHSKQGTDWNYYDSIFGNAALNGVTILPQLGEGMNGNALLPNKNEAEEKAWIDWAKQAVRRYGYNGVYWSTHPGVPYRPAVAWELWNEPNNPSFGSISATAFGAFLLWAGNAVQSASEAWSGQKTNVLFGGLLAWGSGTNYQNYLSTAYAIGGGSVTGIAFHPYLLDPASFAGKTRIQAFQSSVSGARTFINSLSGGSGKSIWITETGWPAEANYSVGEAEQASLLKASFDWCKANAASLNLQSVVWYNYRDIFISPPIWQYRSGLRKEGGGYRLSWWAFQQETGAPAWPPASVQATTATSIQEEKATLNGTIDTNRIQTSYHFDFGVTTAYGKSAPVPDASAGSGSGSFSVTVQGLLPNTRYHYRLVASNAAGTSYSSDQTLTTTSGAHPSVVIDPANGLAATWRGSDGNLYQTVAPGGKSWTTFSPTWGSLPGSVKVTGNPASVIDPVNGLAAVWRGSDGNLYQTAAPGGKSWSTFSPTWGNLPTGVEVAGNPAVVIDPANGLAAVWRGSDGNLYQTVAPGGKSWTTFSPTWGNLPAGVKVVSDPAVVIDPANGLAAVWRGSDGNLYQTVAPGGKSWTTFSPTWGNLPGSVKVTGDPAVVIDPANGLAAVWRGSDGNLYQTVAPGGKSWTTFSPTWGNLPGGVTVVSDPSVVIDPANGLAATWRGSDGNLYQTAAPGGKSWSTFSPTWGNLPGSVKVTRDPAAVIDPANGLAATWRGSDGNLYQTAAPGGKSWSTFSPTWGNLPSGVTVPAE